MKKSILGKCALVAIATALCATAHASSMLYVSDQFGGNVHVIDTSGNFEVGLPISLSHAQPLAPVVSRDGEFVYVQSVDGAISVIETDIHAVVRTFDNPNPAAGGASMTLSPDGRILYAIADVTGDIARIDTTSGAVTSRITGNSVGHSPLIRVSHDGLRLYVLDAVAGKITALDAASGTVVGQVAVPLSGQLDQVPGFALTPDDGTIATVTYLGNFVTIDTATMTVQSSALVGRTLNGIDLSPDGSHAFIAQSNDGCLIDFDMPDGVTSGTGIGSDVCIGVAASRDNHSVYIANFDVTSNAYAVFAFDSADRTVHSVSGLAYPGFGYPSFDAQSIGPATTTPMTGSWWNPAESGRAFNIEVRRGTLVLTAEVYDEQGAPTWLLASGPYDSATGTFVGTFGQYAGGQCLGCAYRAPQYSPVDGGNVQLVFSSETRGTLTFDGVSLPIQKFDW